VGLRGRGRPWLAVTALACILVVAVGGYALFSHLRPRLIGTGCRADTRLGSKPLAIDQAANAATIAGVAFRKDLPVDAVKIAYATALQESGLRNLPHGDRDSVGLFQQRPSQGWGPKHRIRDPIYATNRFFDALVKVRDYRDWPLEEVAQKIQRSADGNAYAQHEPDAKLLAAAFTGQANAAVRCWYPPAERPPAARRSEAVRELRRAFGPLRVGDDGPGGGVVMAPSRRTGWAVAVWAVTHAREYGLTRLGHAGRRWEAGDGQRGWTSDPRAPADRVTLR
jgi:hypothetical protein